MDDRSTDIFGPVEENSDDRVEEEPEEEQEKDELSSIFEEEGEVEDDKPDFDPWRPLRQKVGHIAQNAATHPGLKCRVRARFQIQSGCPMVKQ